MTYIYDIALNFQDNYYQFFEWNKHDKIKNLSKLPIYHVTDEDILNFKNNKVKVDISTIQKFKEENNKRGKIILLVSNSIITIGLLFDLEGNVLKKSSLIYEEEDEANDIAMHLPLTKITYQEIVPINEENKLRIEIEKKETLIHYIKENQDKILLKYLYYEYFHRENNNLEQIKEYLLNEIEKNWTKKQNDLYHLVALISKNKLSLKERTNSS